jgi:transcriptional regulator with XRE-family HTH domain
VELTVRDLQQSLAPTATTAERVKALLAVGLTAADIAELTGVSVSAIRNWSAGQASPRPDAERVLDDLRHTVAVLLDSGLEPDRAARWLKSRRTDEDFDNERPIDLLREKPLSVFAAANEELVLAGG